MKEYCFYQKRFNNNLYFVKIIGYEETKQVFYEDLEKELKGYRREDLYKLVISRIRPEDTEAFTISIVDDSEFHHHSHEKLWFKGAKLHREDGAANIEYDCEYGEEYNQDFYLDGVFIGRDLNLDNLEDIRNYQVLK